MDVVLFVYKGEKPKYIQGNKNMPDKETAS